VNLTCIINPHAGRRSSPREVAEAVHRVAEPLGWQVATVLTQEPGQATDLVRQATERSDLFVAAGGDGTAHEVATALVGTEKPLLIIPTGSGNGLARALGIPTRMEQAVDLLTKGERRAIDVGKMNERYFFSTAGIGFDAEVGRRYNEAKHRRGLFPYFRCGLNAWLDYVPQPLTIDLGGERLDEAPLLLVVANTDQYGYRAIIAPGAVPDDGLLKVCRIMQMSTLRLLISLPRLFLGTLDRSRYFRARSASEFVVERRNRGHVQIDGEAIEADAKLAFSILPKALTVIVPGK